MFPAACTAMRVADNIINLCHDRHIEITNLKLQKLLYYAQAWYLVLHDRCLFAEDLEAWVHGPVVAKVFGNYKEYRWSPIDCVGSPPDSEIIARHVSDVIDVYGEYSATQLERMTHTEPPWLEARGTFPPDVPSRTVISLKTMRDYYASLVDG